MMFITLSQSISYWTRCYMQPRRTGTKSLQWIYGWYLLMILSSISWPLHNVSQIVIIFPNKMLILSQWLLKHHLKREVFKQAALASEHSSACTGELSFPSHGEKKESSKFIHKNQRSTTTRFSLFITLSYSFVLFQNFECFSSKLQCSIWKAETKEFAWKLSIQHFRHSVFC